MKRILAVVLAAVLLCGILLLTVSAEGQFVPVANVSVSVEYLGEVPISIGICRALTGTVQPSNATNQVIRWNIEDDGGIAILMIGGLLFTKPKGTGIVTVKASIEDGIAPGVDYTQIFRITIPFWSTWSPFFSAGSGWAGCDRQGAQPLRGYHPQSPEATAPSTGRSLGD